MTDKPKTGADALADEQVQIDVIRLSELENVEEKFYHIIALIRELNDDEFDSFGLRLGERIYEVIPLLIKQWRELRDNQGDKS